MNRSREHHEKYGIALARVHSHILLTHSHGRMFHDTAPLFPDLPPKALGETFVAYAKTLMEVDWENKRHGYFEDRRKLITFQLSKLLLPEIMGGQLEPLVNENNIADIMDACSGIWESCQNDDPIAKSQNRNLQTIFEKTQPDYALPEGRKTACMGFRLLGQSFKENNNTHPFLLVENEMGLDFTLNRLSFFLRNEYVRSNPIDCIFKNKVGQDLSCALLACLENMESRRNGLTREEESLYVTAGCVVLGWLSTHHPEHAETVIKNLDSCHLIFSKAPNQESHLSRAGLAFVKKAKLNHIKNVHSQGEKPESPRRSL